MRFQPGQSGNPRGRPKGAKNKASVQTREDLWDYIAACGEEANPFKRLVTLMMTTDNEAIEIACAQALADRLLPKLKAIEVSGDDAHPLRVIAEYLDGLNEHELRQLAFPNGTADLLPHQYPSAAD